MQVEVSKTDSYYQIRIPIKAHYSNYQVRKFMDYLKIKKIAEKSAATDDDHKKPFGRSHGNLVGKESNQLC